MMNIKIQIYSFIFSFFMGIFLYIISLLNYKIIFKKKTYLKFLYTLLVMLDYNLIFLVGLYYINDGIIHIYFIITLIIAFLISVKIMPRVIKSDKLFKIEWYN